MKVPPGWEIPSSIRAQLGDQSGRQRALDADGHVVIVVHKVPRPRSHQREGIAFWRNPEGQWSFNGRGNALNVLKQQIDAYQKTFERLSEEHDSSETASDKFRVLESIGPLNRAARNLHDTLMHARDSVESHDGRRELQKLCDQASDISRACELLHDDARHALDFYIAKQAELQAAHSRELQRAGHKLNTVAAIFLPLTAVASVFGMNLKNGLENAPPWMFWLVLLGSITAGYFASEILVGVKTRRQRIT